MSFTLSESAVSRLKYCWNRFCLVAGRPGRQSLKLMRLMITGFVVFFSPFIVWIILAVNRELIHYVINARWMGFIAPDALRTMREDVNSRWFVSGFNEAALGGLLTLYGVIVTVWYYHSVRRQELAEKRLFMIDELVEELKKNKKMLEDLSGEEIYFHTNAWERLGADAAMLPRALHLKLSVLYSCLADCRAVEDYRKRRATIDRLPGVISELLRYRRKFNRSDLN